MNFDQMVQTWKAQDDQPLYGVNADLLRLVLQHEEADLRRRLRREHWAMYAGSAVMLAFSGLILWAFVYYRGPLWGLAMSAVATAAAAAGAATMWLSRRRQADRERSYGHSLQEEIRRNLSLVDYQLSRKASTERILLSTAPLMVAAAVCLFFSWLVNEGSQSWWQAVIAAAVMAAVILRAAAESRRTRRQLLPRRERLGELLQSLEVGE